jgi:hypothetical protein
VGWRIALGVFLILHGLIHPGVYAPPATDPSRPDFHRSWLLARLRVDRDAARRLSIVISVIAAAAFVVAGIALLAGGRLTPIHANRLWIGRAGDHALDRRGADRCRLERSTRPRTGYGRAEPGAVSRIS